MPARFRPSCAAKNRPRKSGGPTDIACSTIAAPTAAASGAPKNTVDAEAERLVKPADRPGVGTGDADHQQRDEQKRAGKRHVEAERHGHRPDAERDAQPQRKRPAQRATSRPGRRMAPRPVANFSAMRAIRPANADGSDLLETLEHRREPRRIAGQDEQHDQRGQRDARRRWRRPTSPPRTRPDSTSLRSRPNTNTYDASRTSTVIVSSSRSRTIVANAPGGAHRLAARQKVRAHELAGRAPAASCARRIRPPSRETSCAKLALPSGSSRYCQRHARIARFTNIVASESSQPSRAARARSRARRR